jgi:hypothetical protein
MKTIHQKSALELRAVFTTQSGGPAVPTTAHWRVWCLETDEALTDWAQVTVSQKRNEFGEITEAYALVVVPGSVHVKQTSKSVERKQVVIVADKDLATEYTKPVPYSVRGVKGRAD